MDFFDEFEILGCIGQGGFGAVLKVKDKRASSEFAIKLIPMRRRPDDDVVVREVETLAKLSSLKGVVKYHHSWYKDFETPKLFEEFTKKLKLRTGQSMHFSECVSSCSSNQGLSDIAGMFFIKMDYFNGKNLKEWLRSLCIAQDGILIQPWLHGQIMLTFYKVLQIVDEIHSSGILHRDLKPENILFQEPARICICDFGLSKSSVVIGNTSGEAQHTSDIGTRAYLAPELLQGQPHSFQSDAYALGLVFLEMLTTYGEVTEREKSDIFECHKRGEIHQRCANFKLEADLIRRMLLNDPKLRCSIKSAMADKVFNIKMYVCNICNLKINGIKQFMMHLVGAKHKKAVDIFRKGGQVEANADENAPQNRSIQQVQPDKLISNNGMVFDAENRVASLKPNGVNPGSTSHHAPTVSTILISREGDVHQQSDERNLGAEVDALGADVRNLANRMSSMEQKIDQVLCALSALNLQR